MAITKDSSEDVPIQEVPITVLERRRRRRIGALLVIPVTFLTWFAIMTFVDKTFFIFNLLTFIVVFYVAALSLDLEVGSLGLPNFGKVGFIAIGAYGFALTFSAVRRIAEQLSIQETIGVLAVAFIFAILVPLVLAGIFGYILAIPTVKLRADYFAIMTISGAEVIRFLLQNESRYLWQPTPFAPPQQLITNQVKNILVTTFPFNEKIDLGAIALPDFIGNFIGPIFRWSPNDNGIYSFSIGTVFIWQIFMLTIFVIVAYLIYWFVEQLRKAPYGRTMRAIRDDDITVTSVGKDVSRFRWQITVISATICSIAGMMFAMTFSAFEHGAFRPVLTFQLFIFIIIGGLGNSRGALVGTAMIVAYLNSAQADVVRDAIAFRLSPETVISLPFIGDIHIVGDILKFLQIDMIINPDNSKWIVLGSLLIFFLLFMPSGLIPEPKTDNEKYMSLLTTEERQRSDAAIARRQSLAERERIDSEANKILQEDQSLEKE